jgi:hypothetical protein
MINNQEDIRDIFNIFHDGDIIGYSLSTDSLCLVIEIPHLAKRINKNFTKFKVMFYGCKDVSFRTWPRLKNAKPEIITEIDTIFKDKHWILDAEIIQDKFKVACSQADEGLDFCGGDLSFSATSANVTDENRKEYTIDELASINEAFWDEWAKK